MTAMNLSFRLIRLWHAYERDGRNLKSAIATYGRNAPATIMRGSVVKAALEAYFAELEKHVDQEQNIYQPRPRDAA
jgi:hypothetical protein